MKVAIDIRRIADFGVGTSIRNLVQTLASQGGENHYLLVEEPGQDDMLGPLPENFTRRIFLFSDQSARNHVQFQFLLRTHAVDLLHVPHTRVPLFVPCRYVVTVHDLADFFFPVEEHAVGLRSSVRYFLARRALGGAARVLAVSKATGKDVVRHFRIDPAKLEVVYNAIDAHFAQPSPPEDRERSLERYGVNYPFL